MPETPASKTKVAQSENPSTESSNSPPAVPSYALAEDGLHQKQREFVNDTARYTLCEAGTKSGKTLGCAFWLVERARQAPDTIWWWIAPSFYAN